MKKRIFPVLVILLSLAFMSCDMPGSENKGHIVVSNKSSDDSIITEIYVKSEFSSGFSKVFDGQIDPDRNYCVELAPGHYAVKIAVFHPLSIIGGNMLGILDWFETGYNIYKEAEAGKFLYVDFDGNGIYFR